MRVKRKKWEKVGKGERDRDEKKVKSSEDGPVRYEEQTRKIKRKRQRGRGSGRVGNQMERIRRGFVRYG